MSLLKNFDYETVLKAFDGGLDTGSGGGGPWVMPVTIEKYAKILRLLYAAKSKMNPNTKFTIPGPAVGATPVMTAKWGD